VRCLAKTHLTPTVPLKAGRESKREIVKSRHTHTHTPTEREKKKEGGGAQHRGQRVWGTTTTTPPHHTAPPQHTTTSSHNTHTEQHYSNLSSVIIRSYEVQSTFRRLRPFKKTPNASPAKPKGAYWARQIISKSRKVAYRYDFRLKVHNFEGVNLFK
jgi:hypothetical protein